LHSAALISKKRLRRGFIQKKHFCNFGDRHLPGVDDIRACGSKTQAISGNGSQAVQAIHGAQDSCRYNFLYEYKFQE
jgi:hypothetical protein